MSERNIEPGFKRKITALNWVNVTHLFTLLVNVQGFKTGLQLVSTVVFCSVDTDFAFTHQAFRWRFAKRNSLIMNSSVRIIIKPPIIIPINNE